jgi:hypothetical protein
MIYIKSLAIQMEEAFDDSDVGFAPHKHMSKCAVFTESNYLNAFFEEEKACENQSAGMFLYVAPWLLINIS